MPSSSVAYFIPNILHNPWAMRYIVSNSKIYRLFDDVKCTPVWLEVALKDAVVANDNGDSWEVWVPKENGNSLLPENVRICWMYASLPARLSSSSSCRLVPCYVARVSSSIGCWRTLISQFDDSGPALNMHYASHMKRFCFMLLLPRICMQNFGIA